MVYEKIFRKPFSKTFHASSLPLCSLSLLSLSLAQQASVLPEPPPCPSSPSQKSPSPLVFFSQTPTPYRFGYWLGTGADLRPTWARDGYDRLGFEMVAMGCRSLGFATVASGSGHCASLWASPISLSPDCVTGLRDGLELRHALAPRTDVAHDCDDLWVLICLFWFVLGFD